MEGDEALWSFGKGEREKRPSRKKVFLAILSGLLLTAAFPPLGLSLVAWIALVPLFFSLDNEPPSVAFRLGLIAGLVHFLSLIYWIAEVLGRYGNLHFLVSLVPLGLLCLYLALYLGLFSLLVLHVRDSRFLPLFAACFWVCLEFVRAKALTGFPWCLLGYSQYTNLPLVQVTDLTGVYGLSFLIVFSNGLIFSWMRKHPHRTMSTSIVNTGLFVCMVGLVLVYGHKCLSEVPKAKGGEKEMTVSVIQANIDQSVKWDPQFQEETLAIYERLTRAAKGSDPDVIVWPETAVPFFFQDRPKLAAKVRALAKESGVTLIFGSPAYRRVNGKIEYYNRAYMISNDGKGGQFYDKVHLVPFGEYVPLKSLLFFVDRLVPAAGDFKSGDKIAPLSFGDLAAGVLICFEAVFPGLANAHRMAGANFLVNLTNDAWFGMTSAPYQHLSMAVFRAVENRLPMIRAANTGFSAFVTPRGKIVRQTGLFREEVLTGTISLRQHPVTFYARHGDIFSGIVLILSLAKILSTFRKGR